MKFSLPPFLKKKDTTNDSKHSSDAVAQYYEEFTDIYLKATGDFIQAYRTFDTDSLMEYLVESMRVKDGMQILDAGCGVGAPAIWIAQKFPNTKVTCITNSEKQYQIALNKINSADIQNRIILIKGDYHQLGKICQKNSFDLTMFLESLGHNQNLNAVLSGVKYALKPGGALYIKDFFSRLSNDLNQQKEMDEIVKVINDVYCYNVMKLPELIDSILKDGFTLNYTKIPDAVPDIGVTIAFEEATGRLTYPYYEKIRAVDWYEILATSD